MSIDHDTFEKKALSTHTRNTSYKKAVGALPNEKKRIDGSGDSSHDTLKSLSYWQVHYDFTYRRGIHSAHQYETKKVDTEPGAST